MRMLFVEWGIIPMCCHQAPVQGISSGNHLLWRTCYLLLHPGTIAGASGLELEVGIQDCASGFGRLKMVWVHFWRTCYRDNCRTLKPSALRSGAGDGDPGLCQWFWAVWRWYGCIFKWLVTASRDNYRSLKPSVLRSGWRWGSRIVPVVLGCLKWVEVHF